MSEDAAEKQPLLSNHRSIPQDAEVEANAEANAEPSLAQLQQNVVRAQRDYMRAWSRTTNGRFQKSIMLSTTCLLMAMFMISVWILTAQAILEDDDLYATGKVAVEAHIMSKCPDARDCLRELILPAMVNVSDKVDFTLSFIGSSTDHDDGVLCKHGPPECLGNIIELCAAKLYPDPKIYLGFTMCLSKDYEDIPKQELIEDCALEHGISFEKLNKCATEDDGKHSVELLQDSFARSARANVSTSCTIRVAEKVFCIRDGGEWKDCPLGDEPQDLVARIEQEYAAAQ